MLRGRDRGWLGFFLIHAATIWIPAVLVFHWFSQPPTAALWLGPLLIGPALQRLVFRRSIHPHLRALSRIADLWFGLAVVVAPIAWTLALASVVVPIPGLWAGVASLALGAGAMCFGLFEAQRIGVTRYRVTLQGTFLPTLIVHVSDLHLGSRSAKFLGKVALRASQTEGDVLCVTGDFVDAPGFVPEDLSPFATACPHSLAVLGNHDLREGGAEVEACLATAGFDVLRNRSSIIRGLNFVGLDDSSDSDAVATEIEQLLKNGAREPVVLLFHRPPSARIPIVDVDLTLCGHTHGGQLAWLRPFVRRMFGSSSGLSKLGEGMIHVSPGVGTWGPPIRVGVRPTIAVIELVPVAQLPLLDDGPIVVA